MVTTWHAALARAIAIAVEEGHLHADTDPQQMLFELHGLILALHHDARFLRNPGVLDRARRGFARVIADYQTTARSLPPSFPGVVPCPPTTRRCATCSSCCTNCCRPPALLSSMPQHQDIDADTLDAVLEQAGKFAAEVVAPLNLSGDAEGCTLDKATHEVTAPKGFKEAYAAYVEGGWPA